MRSTVSMTLASALLGDDEQDGRLGVEHRRRARELRLLLLDAGHVGEAHDVCRWPILTTMFL